MDLFAGCGGFAEGFRSCENGTLGGGPLFRTVTAVDHDPSALATFAANHRPGDAECCDIEEFDTLPFADEVDVITGGPPCQGFSSLGRQRPDDPRNALWEEYVRVVATVRPRVFVMENVDRFLTSPEYAKLEEAVRPGGALADYELAGGLLNSADYGVPQARRRVIVIGTHKDLGPPLSLPAPTHCKPLPLDTDLLLFGCPPRLESWVPVDTVFDRSSQLAITRDGLPSRVGRDGTPGPYRTDELHFGRNPVPLSLARYRVIPAGGSRRDLRGKWAVVEGQSAYLSTSSWDNHTTGSADVMGRLRLGRPSVTIRTEFYKPEKGRYLHPSEDRPITHFEAALIQGFPEGYLWHGSKIQIARQIGNALPVGLARALGDTIHQRLTVATDDEADLASAR
ncbi:DNA cytosine methyltransferase [Streptomyces lunaelactis]|nr:DNA cytosine methyltransferase [Streptomyces lunaelactis]NUK18500.1 DNA cytosine methyltransferase [Streptomyces lunaelactis]